MPSLLTSSSTGNDENSKNLIDDLLKALEGRDISNVDNKHRREMLQKVDSHLENHPDDDAMLLLQAELCFALDQRPGLVGDFLAESADKLSDQLRFRRLKERVNSAIQRKLERGRRLLKDIYDAADALEAFEHACSLSANEPAICLAASFAYVNALLPPEIVQSDNRHHLGYLLTQIPIEKLADSADPIGQAESFLTQALNRTEADPTSRLRILRHMCLLWVLQITHQPALAFPVEIKSAGPLVLPDDSGTVILAYLAKTAAQSLRSNRFNTFDQIMHAIERIAPGLPARHILLAEKSYLTGDHAAAIEQYQQAEQALALPGAYELTQEPLMLDEVITEAIRKHVECDRCGHKYSVLLTTCPICGLQPQRSHLIFDSLIHQETFKGFLSDGDLIASGLARLELEFGDPVLSMSIARRITNEAVFADFQERIHDKFQQLPLDGNQLVRGLDNLGHLINTQDRPELTSFISDDLYCDPLFWAQINQQYGHMLVSQLVDHGHITYGQNILDAVQRAHPDSEALSHANMLLHERVQRFLQQKRSEAHDALSASRSQAAIDAATQVLIIEDNDLDIRLVRARAYQQANRLEQACRDYQYVADHGQGRTAEQAALSAAELYAAMANYKPAYDLLSRLPDIDGVKPLLADVRRHVFGQPFVETVPTDRVVMIDTLSAVNQQAVHAYFAVKVTSTLRVVEGQHTVDAVIGESLQFSGIIGSLYHTEGEPVFALRLIREVEDHRREAGVAIALVTRVTGDKPETAERLALDLWEKIRNILPGARLQLFQYEPVYSRSELLKLLQPFEANTITEIVRRETPATDSHIYTISQFALGDLTLQRLMHTLLEQNTDTMVSIHLVPTTLTPWEEKIWAEQLSPGTTAPSTQVSPYGADLETAVDWESIDDIAMQQRMRHILHEMRSSCFVMRVHVALGEPAPTLVVQRVASALFNINQNSKSLLEGGVAWIEASDTESFTVAKRNLEHLDVEQWGHTLAPKGLERIRWLVNHREATMALRLPVPDSMGVAGLELLETRPIAPPSDIPGEGVVLGKSVYRRYNSQLTIRQLSEDRRRHSYIVGKTGSGKTTLMQRMALQDIHRGEGVCIVDPHGDLVEDILQRIPPHRQKDVIIFDASDYDRPIGLNLLEHNDEMHRHMIVNEFIGLLVRMYDPHQQGIAGPRFQHNVRHAMLTALEFEGSTLIEVVRILTDSDYVRALLPHIKDPIVKQYWEKQIANTSDWHKSEVLDYIVSKFSRFVGDRRVRQIIGQSTSTINFRHIMDNRKILLANLSKGKVGAENAQFLGLLFVNAYLIAALGRASVEREQRPDAYLYVDEFQNFATDLFSVVLSEGRKYGVAAVCANQYLTQIPFSVREAVFGNIGTLICFRLGLSDALTILPELQPGVDASSLINLPQFTTYTKLLLDGNSSRTFTMQTLPEETLPDAQSAEQLREFSRQRYGTDTMDVNREIEARMRSTKAPKTRWA